MTSKYRGVPTERRKPCNCRYRCIERACRSVGILLSGNRAHSSKWLSTESAILGFRLNSNILNISFAMGIFI